MKHDNEGGYIIDLSAATAAGPGAAANLVSFRWISSTFLAVLRRIELQILGQ